MWSSWLWLYDSWNYNFLCNQCPSPITFESRSWRGVFDTKLCDKVWQFLVTVWWFSTGTPISSTNKLTATIYLVTEQLLKVVLSNIASLSTKVNVYFFHYWAFYLCQHIICRIEYTIKEQLPESLISSHQPKKGNKPKSQAFILKTLHKKLMCL